MTIEYDTRFKKILTMFFHEFLDLFVPEFAKEIDWSCPVEFLDKELNSILGKAARRTVDVLAKAHTRIPAESGDRSRLLLVHVEVQARGSQAELGRRMFSYFSRTSDWFRVPVLPIALYLHLRRDGIGWQEHFIMVWEHELVRFHFPYIALAGLDGEQFLAKQNPLAWALTGLMRFDPERRARVKAESLRRIQKARMDERRRDALVQCVEAYTTLDAEQQRLFEQLIESKPYEEVKTMIKTTFEKGMEQGIEQGIERGIEEGIERGQHELLVDMLEEKFGELSPRTRKRVQALSSNEAKKLGVKLLTAESLAELGL